MAALVWATQAGAAIAPGTIRDLAFGESDARGKAIAAIVASGDAQALPLLQAVLDGEIKTAGEDRVLQVKGDAATDLLTGKSVTPVPDNLDDSSSTTGCAASSAPRLPR